MASDPDPKSVRGLDPTDPAASQGEPPYFLACSVCRWDSKSVGLVFEKPTGLSLQLQRSEENAADVLEFDRLKDHFDPYLKAQTQAAITSAAVGSGSSSRARSLPASTVSAAQASSSSSAEASTRSARATAARNAAAAALQSSKLVQDLPHLAHSKHAANSARSAPIEPDELKTYRALNPWQPVDDGRSRSSGHAAASMGVVAKREKHRRDYVARVQLGVNQPFASLDAKISSLEQRWSSVSIADQPVRAAELRPNRVSLKSKLSKRCPACRHIVIKPDIKAASNRFKIKLVALNFLPEIQIALADQQPYLDALRFRSTGVTGSNLMGAASTSSSLRRRPQSVLVSGADSLGPASSLFNASQDVDVNRLIAGQTYSYQIAVTNPLDDPVELDMSFVRFANASLSRGAAAVQPLPEPKYIFSWNYSNNTSSAPSHVKPSEGPSRPTRRARLGWQVYPSTTSISLNAFNEVWELEDAEELYHSKTELETHPESLDGSSPRRSAVKTAYVDGAGRLGCTNEPAWVIQEHEDDEDDTKSNRTVQRKPFLQKGHTTIFYLDLVVSATELPKPGPIEIGMHVTYRYTGGANQPSSQGLAPAGKDFSFWTSIRLGSVVGRDERDERE